MREDEEMECGDEDGELMRKSMSLSWIRRLSLSWVPVGYVQS